MGTELNRQFVQVPRSLSSPKGSESHGGAFAARQQVLTQAGCMTPRQLSEQRVHALAAPPPESPLRATASLNSSHAVPRHVQAPSMDMSQRSATFGGHPMQAFSSGMCQRPQLMPPGGLPPASLPSMHSVAAGVFDQFRAPPAQAGMNALGAAGLIDGGFPQQHFPVAGAFVGAPTWGVAHAGPENNPGAFSGSLPGAEPRHIFRMVRPPCLLFRLPRCGS